MRPAFPFTAIVGQEDMKLALVLNAVAPEIGGVLIQGERGTAKSTAARALAALLPEIPYVPGCPLGCDPEEPAAFCPHCRGLPPDPAALVWRRRPVVELPLGAGEERVLGHLDLEAALAEGRQRFTPGLLFAAHRGILYVDEVNLLPDHLVDVLLDVAASGRHRLEREGLSAEHPARFTLVGTMNPEEGELRPQLLDRFGLGVTVTAPRDPEARAAVVRRRLAFDRDPEGFGRRFAAAEEEQRRRIARARQVLPEVVFPASLELELARLVAESGVAGMRADIVAYRTARALAAYEGRREVTDADLRTALRLTLPHRGGEPPEPPPPSPPPRPASAPAPSEPRPAAAPAAEGGSPLPDRVEPPLAEGVRLKLPGDRGRPGRLRLAPEGGGRHFRVAAVRGGGAAGVARAAGPRDVAWRETLLAAALARRPEEGRPGRLRPRELLRRRREGRSRLLLAAVVDASGSMSAYRRMRRTKAALLALVERAYQARDRVMLVSFRGERAEVVLPPTRGVRRAASCVAELPSGGRTPLAAGIALARRVLVREVRRHPTLVPALVLVTDGRANAGGGEPHRLAEIEGRRLRRLGVPAWLLDPDDIPDVGSFRARLAAALGAARLPLSAVVGAIRRPFTTP